MANQPLNIEDVPEHLKPYFEAKQNGVLSQYYLTELRGRRDNYSDSLPGEDIRTLTTLNEENNFEGDNYKCRGNYIVGLSSILNGAILDGVISDESLELKIKNFRQHNFEFTKNMFTTPQEMGMINQILDDTIRYLENLSQ